MAEPKKSKYGAAKSAVIGLCVAATVSVLTWAGIFQKLELFVTDKRYVHRPKIAVDTSIVLIEIDEPSVQQIGRWPWTWDRHAAVLDMLRLYGGRQAAFVEPYYSEPGAITVQKDHARQIAVNVSQTASGQPGVDYRAELESLIPDFNDRFLKSVEQFPNTFIANAFSIPEGAAATDREKIRRMTESYKFNFSRDKKEAIASMDTFSLVWPNPGSLTMASDVIPVTAGLSRRMIGTGFTRIIQDIDGIVRRTPLLVWYDGRAYPSIALSMAAEYFDCPLEHVKIEPGRSIEIPGKVKTVRIPIDKNGYMLVNWGGAYQETFMHLPYNVIALHYMHRVGKMFIRQFRLGFDNPQEVMQKLGEFLLRQQMLPMEDVERVTTELYLVWIMDFFMDQGAPYDAFLKNTGLEDAPILHDYWTQLSINKRTEEVVRSGQTPDYSAVLFSLGIKDTDIYKVGYNHTLFFYGNGRINEVRPLYFMEPSIIDVSGVEMRFSPMDLAGKTVFIGLTATGLNAFNPIPYQQRYQMFGLIPNIYNTIITEQFLHAQSAWVQYLYILFYSLAVTWLVLHFRPVMGFVAVLLTSAIHVALAWLIFMGAGIMIAVVAPVVAVVVCYVAANLYRYVEEQRERQKVRGLFGAMVSPEVLRMMEEHPEKFRLAGEKHEATMFSSDVSGFTTISEGVTAQELADILNIYLTPMSNIIMNFDGFVDKYEGDAIKADYGVPLSDPNHAWKGCLSALLQQEDLQVIQRLLLLKYGVKITARMGVNTGIVAAGNMGSEKKMQYTVMGEAVTLAEELEPINKLYESWIAIGPKTYEKAHDYVEVRHLDCAAMGASGHPTDVYELMGWKREKFLGHWTGRPVPPLFIEAWKKLIPEKILGYIHYWDGRKFKDSPFYKDLRTLFDGLAPQAIEAIHAADVAGVLRLKTDLVELDKAMSAHEKLTAGMAAGGVLKDELEQLRQKLDKTSEDWLKVLLGWKVRLKEHQIAMTHLQGKIPLEEYDELMRLVDTYQKGVECNLKRCSFPSPTDTVASGLAEHLKGLLVNGKASMDREAAQRKSEETRQAIQEKVNAFLELLPARAAEFHEFMAEHCEVPEYKFRVKEVFGEARKFYLKQDWAAAESALKKVLEIDPKDGPAIKYIERIAHLRKSPPPKDWDGVWAEE